MSLAQTLLRFQNDVAQCDSLIASAHRCDQAGASIFPSIDREQITAAAFLNMFKAWEAFLEGAIAEYMVGRFTTAGHRPKKFVKPKDLSKAKEFVIGPLQYFDYANHDRVKKIVNMYFDGGYPFEPHISAIFLELSDLKTIRNACAHISSTTSTSLEALAGRIFGSPRPGITVYGLLTAVNPSSVTGDTIFVTYRDKLLVTAGLISQG